MKPAEAAILTIGNELLSGFTLDTNAHWIGMELEKAGFRVVKKTTVGDCREAIMSALEEAVKGFDITIITGGLGPTHDDITKSCLAEFFDCEMALHAEALTEVAQYLNRKEDELSVAHRRQAMLPVACEKISNKQGTAPGMWFLHPRGAVAVALPGVPKEMKAMLGERVIPKLRERFATLAVRHHVVCTAGVGESALAAAIALWQEALPPHIQLAYLPGPGEVRLRLTGRGASPDALAEELQRWAAKLVPLVGPHIYGSGEASLEEAVGRLLRAQRLTVAVAESCTGGYLSHRITRVAGSSDYYRGAVVAYDNAVKTLQLGISSDLLCRHGAVSRPVVEAMAEEARTRLNADIGIATSGVAGPGGGTARTPVGTVWIALSDGTQQFAQRLTLYRDRLLNIRLSAAAALNTVRLYLVERRDGSLAPSTKI